jgi:N utilization substance protein A
MPTDESERVARLFAQEVPEITAGDVQIKAIARKAGVRCKLASQSSAPGIDALGVCVGVRGSRMRRIVEQLEGERVDVILWDDSPERLIANALQPVKVEKVILHPAQHRATVVVKEDQVSLALGRRGVNRDLASRLCGWEIDVVPE